MKALLNRISGFDNRKYTVSFSGQGCCFQLNSRSSTKAMRARRLLLSVTSPFIPCLINRCPEPLPPSLKDVVHQPVAVGSAYPEAGRSDLRGCLFRKISDGLRVGMFGEGNVSVFLLTPDSGWTPSCPAGGAHPVALRSLPYRAQIEAEKSFF